MSLLTFSCSSKAQKQTTDTGMQSDKKILVAYFSCTGTTEKIAGAIAQAVNVNPEKPDVPLNKNDAFQKVQKRRVQEKR